MFIQSFLLLLAIGFLSAGRVPRPEERIIGGQNIEIEQAPWQVSLQVNGKPHCGGSIYSKDIIITAAHCRFDKERRRLEAKDFLIRVGSSLLNSNGTLVKVAAIRSHESFDFKRNGFNDIAIMRLSEPLKFTSKVQSIPLAKRNPAPGTVAMVSGWGATSALPSHNGYPVLSYPINLQRVYNQIRNRKYCSIFPTMSKNNICAGTYGKTTCSGDSGGPLVVNQELVGVVSGGFKFCDGFSVYASVPSFRSWILNAVASI
ncbi:trypsin beta-like [Drosophila gunungcola]|uniref:trypsin beta-like n=1 Tax=Drosophila gunungcola TaxID=103775 RepID=UPI0022E7C952|nr:trypsin beta-like [Drosophila gunungcola]